MFQILKLIIIILVLIVIMQIGMYENITYVSLWIPSNDRNPKNNHKIGWYFNVSHVIFNSLPINSNNINNIIKWFDPSFVGHCEPQIYLPMLHKRDYSPYLLLTDIMAINNATQVWIFGVDPNAMFARDQMPYWYKNLFGKKVICAYSNGQSVLSKTIMKNVKSGRRPFHYEYGLIIICDIPQILRNKILKTSSTTNIGVSILDIPISNNISSAINSMNIQVSHPNETFVHFEWINISLPICSSYGINNNNNFWYLPSNIHYKKHKKHKYKLGLCTVLNMNNVYYHTNNSTDNSIQYIDYVIEFIEFYKLGGVEQFYLFDLQFYNKSFVFDYIFEYYIKQLQIVTYIPWTIPYTHPDVHQFAALNSCFQRFGIDNEYMINVDLDEFMFSPNISNTLSQQITNINKNTGKDWTLFKVGCKHSGICNFQVNISHYPNRLSMHQCWEQKDSRLNRQKYIVNAKKVDYAFIHYIVSYKELKENETINEFSRQQSKDQLLCIHAHKFPIITNETETIPYFQYIEKTKILYQNIINARTNIQDISIDKSWPALTFGNDYKLYSTDVYKRSNIKWFRNPVCIHSTQCNQHCVKHLNDHFLNSCIISD